MNEYVIDGKLAKRLRKIGLTNSFFRKFNTAGPASHILESAPIDGVWSTNNITLSTVSILPYKFGTSDYRVILVDFEIDQIIESRVRICIPMMMRLIYGNQLSVMNYNAKA